MDKKMVRWFSLVIVLVLALGVTALVSAVSGAAFTTFNAHVDGSTKDVCKNTAINCNIYGAKEYVWLNGGPSANGLGPDGQYFFAVLEPGGQPNPNDQGGVPDKNLSDDYDAYTNRTFTVSGGEVSAYGGSHWLDSGQNEPGPGDPKPNGLPPYIRLFPYSDTTNPGGVYIMAICSLGEGYPVDPRDCKYDAFKVKKGQLSYQFMLSGIKFQDTYADGEKDASAEDPGLAGWWITIQGTGPDGNAIDETAQTGAGGYWEWFSPVYKFAGGAKPGPVHLEICEVLQPGWNQSFPTPSCYTLDFTPVADTFDSFGDLDFGNYEPVDVTACKVRDTDGVLGGPTTPIAGWMVSLTVEGNIVDTQPTGENGCYTWTGLDPGISYDVHEATVPGWKPLAGVDYVWPWSDASSGASLSYTFVNQPLEGCTPGFWQGGNQTGSAGGKWYWDVPNDADWAGALAQPYDWNTGFCGFFGCVEPGTMWYFVNPDMWSTNDDFHKAARSITAGYLNASWGIGYAYTQAELKAMWTSAYNGGTLLALHTELDAANNAYYRTEGGPACPISASIP